MLPFGDIWNEYCEQCGTSEGQWFDEVKRYEAEVLSQRK
jgi:L-rhamnose isomerase